MEREQYLEVYRHSLSHILAKAVFEIFGKENVQYAIGPQIADGFYYDFILPRTIGNDDFKTIEDKMREILKRREAWTRKEVSKAEAPKNERKVLFVCSGNTCRSPLAEAIMRHLWKATEPHVMLGQPGVQASLEVSSAGVATSDGCFYTRYSEEIAEYEYDEDITGERSTMLTEDILKAQDLVICVTSDHSHFLRERFPDLSDKIFSFEELLEDNYIDGIDGEVLDPYGREYEVYQKTAWQIEQILRAVLPEILKKWEMT